MRTYIWTDDLIQRSCPLCTGSSHQIVSHQMQHGLNLPTVICLTCGFVFTNPIPPRPIYDRFYTEAYAQFYGHVSPRPVGSLRENLPTQIKNWLTQIESIHPLVGRKLLEIGPGQGLFLWWARQQGCDVLGLEPSPEFQATLQEANLPYVAGNLEMADRVELGTFDMVVMFHVLEHFYEPNSALERCHTLLKPGGILVLEVPNILKPFRSLDRYFLRYVHLSNFSPATLRAMLAKHKFEIVLTDEGGDNWTTPQNLFVIARRSEIMNGEFASPSQPAAQVLETLEVYRRRWRWPLQLFWAVRLAFYFSRRQFFRFAGRMKRRFLR